MSKVDLVAAGLAAVQAGEVQVLSDQLGLMYDAAAQEQKASDGTLTQADLDAAVKAATDPLNAKIAQDATDLAAAQADAATKLAAVQASLDAMTAQDLTDKAVVTNFQGAIAALQAALDALKAALP